MVKLEEVEDEAFAGVQAGTDEDDWNTDDGSDSSSVISETNEIDDLSDETLYERIVALRDVIPPVARARIADGISSTTSWGWWSVSWAAQMGWWVSVSALLVGIPFAMGYSEEQAMVAEEKMATMQQQANEVLAPGSQSGSPRGAGGQPAL